MQAQKRRAGRPTKPPKSGDRVSLGLRVTADVKARLDAVAGANGRSQSQEAELRLEQSFKDEDLVARVQDRIYGRAVAGVLMLLGEVIRETATFATKRSPTISDDWIADPHAFEQVARAVNIALDTLRPKRQPAVQPEPDAWLAELRENAATYGTDTLLKAAKGENRFHSLARWTAAVRERLGPALESGEESDR